MYYDFSEQNISEEDPDYESVDNVKPIIKIEERIGFIGSGTMAFVIGSGLINKGVVEAKKILASGMKLSSMTHWKEIGAKVTTNNEDVSKFVYIFLRYSINSIKNLFYLFKIRVQGITKDFF